MSSPLRKPLIAGNWKMHLTLAQSLELARAVRDGVGDAASEVALCVPFTALALVAETLRGSRVRLGAQDLHWETQGAFTGEISPVQLVDAGATMTIIAHSERRRYFNETDEAVNKKLRAALAAKLVPILCIGETLEEREAQRTFKVLQTQLEGGLKGFAPVDLAPLVIAYEPVWAIGTGKTATPDQAQQAHLFVRKTCARLYGEGFASGCRILYGGSVKADNVDRLMAEPDIDGALVGGDSLKAASFLRIVHFQAPAAAR
ncbi:MAG: triose-phosphate isomerase [Elusimicrobia bacterium]|nr:triose-phosphate isomerase [Elusimicrobiota bacterium]MDE2426482.1 triose-phosphate isomerase [Elusimicrobiota bacterium]